MGVRFKAGALEEHEMKKESKALSRLYWRYVCGGVNENGTGCITPTISVGEQGTGQMSASAQQK